MKSTSKNVGDTVTAQGQNDLRADAYGGSMLLPHAQTAPNMTLKIEQGVAYVGATRVIYAGGNTPTITAPTTNPRIDLVTIDSAGTIALVTGVEGASPATPAYPGNKLVLCEIYNRVGETMLYDTDQTTNGYIKNDVRPILGGTYIASDAQVDAAAAIAISKIAFNADFIPDADNTRSVGSSAYQVKEIRAKKLYQDNAALPDFSKMESRQMYTTTGSTTWIAPAGVTQVWITLMAGGGGGGSGAQGNYSSGGGGGGQYRGRVPYTVIPGNSYTVTVGTGGPANTAGGNSVFDALTATGGGAGGAATTGANGGGAGPGGFGGLAGTAGAGAGWGGYGGGSICGDGGGNAQYSSVPAGNGTYFGAGGGGGYYYSGSNRPGGTGSQGFVIIEW